MYHQLAYIFPFKSVQDTPMFILAVVLSITVFCAVLLALHQLSPQAKKWLTIACTFIAGLYFTLEFFIPATREVNGEPQNFLTPSIEPVSDFVQYTMVWTLGLGVISLLLVHGRRLLKREQGWHHSLAFFLAFIAVILAGFWTSAGEKGPAGLRTVFDSLYLGLLVNLDAAMFALLAFYIASAAYRAFRVRTVEAALLMFAALVVMLGMINFGVLLTNWIPPESSWAFFRLERLAQWILNWINMPAYRAVVIGVSVGALAMAMRMWLSLERGAFFSQEK